MSYLKPFPVLFLIPVMLLVACSSFQIGTNKSLINRLNGRGPVALSTTNAYVAQNLLISEEMERSPEINSFVKHRGAPSSLEVYKEFFSPVNLYFYYPENAEMFTMVQEPDGWDINGPQAITPATLELVHLATQGVRGRPKVNFPKAYNKNSNTKESSKSSAMPAELEEFEGAKLDRIGESEATEEGDPLPEVSPLALETESAPIIIENDDTPQQFENQPFKSSTFPLENVKAAEDSALDAIIDTEGISPAELTPKGDLVHYVTYPGESLRLISIWYTKEAGNSGRLARMNKLSESQKLELGDVIIVPSYLLKNSNRLTEEAISKIQQLK